MLFTWDSEKADKNLRKHGISFEVAQTIFDDPLHRSLMDSKTSHEERWVTIGKSIDQRTLVVVHTYKAAGEGSEIIRIISARRATKREVKQYEEGI